MAPNAQIEFTGIDADDCQDFIRYIRQRAFSEGKDRDYDWMARFAATCFAGDALAWHVSLDEDTQNDWKLLEKALVKHFVEGEERSISPISAGVSGIALAPAAMGPLAPSPARAPFPPLAAGSQLVGLFPFANMRCRIRVEPKCRYISRVRNRFGCLVATREVKDALEVVPTAVGAHQRLKAQNSPIGDHPWLGIGWWQAKPVFTSGSTDIAHMAVVKENPDPTTPLQSSYLMGEGPTQLYAWQIQEDGEVRVFWRPSGKVAYPLDIMMSALDGNFIGFTPNYNAFSAKFPNLQYSRVLLRLEQTES